MEQKINVNPEEIQNIVISESTPQTIKLKNLSLETVNINQNENQQINIDENDNQTIYINKGNDISVTDVLVNGISVVVDGIANVIVPTSTSELTNDSGFIKENSLSLVAFSGNYNDLNGKPNIPTKTSNLVNDSGFINKNVSDLTNYTLSSNLSDVATTGNYDDLLNKPNIPTSTSDLNNDSGYITNSVNNLLYYTPTSDLAEVSTTGSYNDLFDKPTIPTSTSELTNDSGFITDSYHDPTKQDTLVSGTNIKTINNTSLLGSGNINISGGSATDVQINGTSITSNDVANIITESPYDETNNKIATMSDIPSVPTKTSELTNDSGFITSSAIPTKTSELTNDSGFITNNYEIYSTTENRVGTWVDGKPLYRKVYNLTITLDSSYYYTYSGDSSTIKSIDNIARFDYFIKNGTLIYRADNSSLNTYNIYLQRSYGGIGFKTNSTNASNYNGKEAIIIIEYTKTSD